MTSSPRAGGGSTSQSAARLLIILDRLGQQPSQAELIGVPDAVKVVRALSRLAKLDFWLRNPDYLADELLTDIDSGHIAPVVGLAQVDRMLAGSAPLLHLYPMRRYKYGAWELPDNAVAVLKSYGFVATHRAKEIDTEAASKARRDYFLREDGAAAVAKMRDEVDQIEWYDEQAEAIKLLDLGATGSAAKTRQYQQPEYKATPVGRTITPILERVRPRFEEMAAKHGYTPAPAPNSAAPAGGES